MDTTTVDAIPTVLVDRADDSYQNTWVVASPDGRIYVTNKVTGAVRWVFDTEGGFLHLSSRGDATKDYVDLKPQGKDSLENSKYPYHFTEKHKPKLMDLETEEELLNYLDDHYKDRLAKVNRTENVYHFNYENGDLIDAALSAFRIKRVDYYMHHSRPDWSLRYSRISAWFPSRSNKERHRVDCKVLHVKDSHRFIQVCQKYKLRPLPGDSPLTELIVSNQKLSDLCTINQKISLGKSDGVEGKHGTLFYKGTYDGINAFIKKVKRSDDPKAIKHKKICRLSGYHENVVAYLGSESNGDFDFLAFEECGITIREYIMTNPYKEASEASLKLMRGVIEGVKHLHSQGITHMNLNPSNILVKGDTVKICGLGNSRFLSEVPDGEGPDVNTIAHTLLYLMSNGAHDVPDVENIGETFEYRILEANDSSALKMIVESAEAWDLFEKIGIIGHTQLTPIQTTITLAIHPEFWSVPKRLGFIEALGDHLREGDPSQQLITDLEALLNDVLPSSNGSWFSVLGGGYNTGQITLLDTMQHPIGNQRPNYQDGKIVSLIKFYRNAIGNLASFGSSKRSQAHQQILLQKLGNNEFELEENLRKKFPRLLVEAFNVVAVHQATIPSLSKYYQ